MNIPKLTNKLSIDLNNSNTHNSSDTKSFKQASMSLNYPSRRHKPSISLEKIEKIEAIEEIEIPVIEEIINEEVEINTSSEVNESLIQVEQKQQKQQKQEEKINAFHQRLNEKIQNRIEVVTKNLIERNIAILQLEVEQVIQREFIELRNELKNYN